LGQKNGSEYWELGIQEMTQGDGEGEGGYTALESWLEEAEG